MLDSKSPEVMVILKGLIELFKSNLCNGMRRIYTKIYKNLIEN